MRTHILYVDDEETFRGTITDCVIRIENEAMSYGDHHSITLIPMIPRGIKFNKLSKKVREEINSNTLVRNAREELNNDLIGGYKK